MSKAELFTPINSTMSKLFKQMERPILMNQFTAANSQIILTLTDSYLVLSQNIYTKVPTHYCQLDFSVKSQFLFHNLNLVGTQPELDLKKPYAMKIQRQQSQQQITFYTLITNVLDLWLTELQKKINQRNFHKLFKAKKKIGKGAFATVYLAQRLRDKKMVAVKAFSKQKQFTGDKGRESLQNQIKLMRHIEHSNIMRLEGVYETQNSIYVILQYLEGVQLNEVLKNGKLMTSEQKCQIIRNLLKGLDYLSQNRIIHRDLKPQNIIFRKQNSTDAIICDFGLATFSNAEKYLFVRCGTPGFVSPQIINIKDMTAKSDSISDVFSAGLILHYLLLGHSIFPGKKYNEILSQNRACDFDFSQSKYHSVNTQAFDLLKKMLQKDPSKRITARKALSHPFFSNCMQIEENEKRSAFKQISYSSYINGQNISQCQQTPSIIGSAIRASFNYAKNLQNYRNQNSNKKNYM